jgi:hypothetical protein
MLGLVPVFIFFSMGAVIAFGLPLFLWARRFDLVNWWSALSSGACIGAVIAAMARYPAAVHVKEISPMVATGAASGIVFWLIWRRGEAAATPNKLSQPNCDYM